MDLSSSPFSMGVWSSPTQWIETKYSNLPATPINLMVSSDEESDIMQAVPSITSSTVTLSWKLPSSFPPYNQPRFFQLQYRKHQDFVSSSSSSSSSYSTNQTTFEWMDHKNNLNQIIKISSIQRPSIPEIQIVMIFFNSNEVLSMQGKYFQLKLDIPPLSYTPFSSEAQYVSLRIPFNASSEEFQEAIEHIDGICKTINHGEEEEIEKSSSLFASSKCIKVQVFRIHGGYSSTLPQQTQQPPQQHDVAQAPSSSEGAIRSLFCSWRLEFDISNYHYDNGGSTSASSSYSETMLPLMKAQPYIYDNDDNDSAASKSNGEYYPQYPSRIIQIKRIQKGRGPLYKSLVRETVRNLKPYTTYDFRVRSMLQDEYKTTYYYSPWSEILENVMTLSTIQEEKDQQQDQLPVSTNDLNNSPIKMISGQGRTPGNPNDMDYMLGCGIGGFDNEDGGDGLVVIIEYNRNGGNYESNRAHFYHVGYPEYFTVSSSDSSSFIWRRENQKDETFIKIKAWGAGGAGGQTNYFGGNNNNTTKSNTTNNNIANGGGGGYTEAEIKVYPGESLQVFVGGGGKAYGSSKYSLGKQDSSAYLNDELHTDILKNGNNNNENINGGYNGGGNGGVGLRGHGGGGGGMSTVYRKQHNNGKQHDEDILLLVAPGGGGGGATDLCCSHGGAGGGRDQLVMRGQDGHSIHQYLTEEEEFTITTNDNLNSITREQESQKDLLLEKQQHLNQTSGYAGKGGGGSSPSASASGGLAGQSAIYHGVPSSSFTLNSEPGFFFGGGNAAFGQKGGGGGGAGYFGGGAGGSGLQSAGGGGGGNGFIHYPSCNVVMHDRGHDDEYGGLDGVRISRRKNHRQYFWSTIGLTLSVNSISHKSIVIQLEGNHRTKSLNIKSFDVEVSSGRTGAAAGAVGEDNEKWDGCSDEFYMADHIVMALTNTETGTNKILDEEEVTLNRLQPNTNYCVRFIANLIHDQSIMMSHTLQITTTAKPRHRIKQIFSRSQTFDDYYDHTSHVSKTRANMYSLEGTPCQVYLTPTPRRGHTLTYLNNKVYLFGGTINGCLCHHQKNDSYEYESDMDYYNQVTFSDELWQFDTLTKEWKLLSTFGSTDNDEENNNIRTPQGREQHSMVAIDGKLLLFGGLGENATIFGDVWEFDVGTYSYHILDALSTNTKEEQNTIVYNITEGTSFVVSSVFTEESSGNDDEYCITNLEVEFIIEHECIEQIEHIFLKGDNNTQVQLFANTDEPKNICTSNTFHFHLSDLAEQSILRWTAYDDRIVNNENDVFSNSSVSQKSIKRKKYKPVESLNRVFQGLPIKPNQWKLLIYDSVVDQKEGMLHTWKLHFNATDSCLSDKKQWKKISSLSSCDTLNMWNGNKTYSNCHYYDAALNSSVTTSHLLQQQYSSPTTSFSNDNGEIINNITFLPRYGFSTVVVNNSIFIMGGHSGSRRLNDILRYDYRHKLWNKVQYGTLDPFSVSAGIDYHGRLSVLTPSGLYIIGGGLEDDDEEEVEQNQKSNKMEVNLMRYDVVDENIYHESKISYISPNNKGLENEDNIVEWRSQYLSHVCFIENPVYHKNKDSIHHNYSPVKKESFLIFGGSHPKKKHYSDTLWELQLIQNSDERNNAHFHHHHEYVCASRLKEHSVSYKNWITTCDNPHPTEGNNDNTIQVPSSTQKEEKRACRWQDILLMAWCTKNYQSFTSFM